MRLLKLILLFSFLLNIPFAALPELEGPLASDQFAHADRTAHTLIIFEQITTTTVKRVVTKLLAPLSKKNTLSLHDSYSEETIAYLDSHNESQGPAPSKARAPPV